MKHFILIVTLVMTALVAKALPPGEGLRLMPVQDAGRIKPYDTFARETLENVYGKTRFEDRDAWKVVLTWMLAPTVWADKELFEVRNRDIQKALGLDESRRWFKGDEVFGKERFPELMQDLRVKRETKEKLTPYFQALQRLENQFFIFREMAQGHLLRVMPTREGGAWIAVSELEEPARGAFLELTKRFVSFLSSGEEGAALDTAVRDFVTVVRTANPSAVAPAGDLEIEVHYNDFHPFRWAYICYLIAALAVMVAWILEKRGLMPIAWIFVLLGFCVHTYGFGLRVYLAGRPPVSNMYETVIWVAWGGVLFSMILEFFSRKRFILMAGALAGMIALIIADTAPAVLDPSIQPLEAVLRSNYWLLVHVMTITISYAAFFLAFVLGDLGLLSQLRQGPGADRQVKELSQAIYRCFQIGVSFLAPGIILGGLWADVSWGRFWGWDPKETWALIVLLGYLAVLHGRMTNWIRDFGMIVSAVVAFSLVVMAWYGVNFVLGAGLHSYGFGAGGVEYVAGVLFVHALLLLYVYVLRKNRAQPA